ncbi:MAG: hypothetical protein HS108_08155 [Planctomycetes bacterium]|nr:hypothetical protein [Planctomycetota bacterium]MCL4730658.1 hypothetical protein [Planctomycetota bacterium]
MSGGHLTNDDAWALACRLAEALDALLGHRRDWHVTRGVLDCCIEHDDPPWLRHAAFVRAAGDHLVVTTAGDCASNRLWHLPPDALDDIVRAVAGSLQTLNLWDLVPGRTFRLLQPLRGLGDGTELRLHCVDEMKPAGLHYQFQHAGGWLVLHGQSNADRAVLDEIGRYLEYAR